MVYDPFSAASDMDRPKCECDPPLEEGAVMCEGGQFGMIKETILSPQGLPLISLKTWFCSHQAVAVYHPLCLTQISHYTPKSSPPSSRGANLPQQSILVPPKMGKYFG